MERENNTPKRVTLTLLYVNQFLGRTLAHLLVDCSHWCCEFCDAVRAVEYHSPDWQAALNWLALRMTTSASPSPSDPRPAGQPRHPSRPMRGPASRTPIMPDHLCSPRGMATAVSRASSPLPAACATVATPTDVPTISAHTAGKAASSGSSRSSSTDTTDPIAATATTDSTPEEAEELPVRRHFGLPAFPQ
ncbi:hypothetical protein PR003_g17656 [Phytophthora rubi]|uniref:Uncharacterized protein n=1 Tax=Phytophthora rubi TaxID=129364 RepID=A0A6A3KAQ7_9STRA|nr:hypothetical protein PR002_g16972 [Phytophthora rubi]KAE9320696.1 hypothetical protein PR003_g17656 [Phytophthora rubi]